MPFIIQDLDQNYTWQTDPPVNRKKPSVLDFLAAPRTILMILAMVMHLALLGILAARIYHFVKQGNIQMAKWLRLHFLIGMTLAHLHYMLVNLLLPIGRMQDWTSESSCVIPSIFEGASRLVAVAYLAVAGLQTMIQVYQPSLLIGNTQFIIGLSMHGVIWFLSFAIMSILGKYIVNWSKYCNYNLDIFINFYIVTTCVPLAIFILSAVMSVAGLTMTCVRGRPCVTDDTPLQWVIRSRVKAVIFVAILAILTATILIPLHAIYAAYLSGIQMSVWHRDTFFLILVDLLNIWTVAEFIFYILFPVLCLILDEVGAYQVCRRLRLQGSN